MDKQRLSTALAEVNLVKPTLYVSARADRILYDAKGKELTRIVDRPFRGFGVNR